MEEKKRNLTKEDVKQWKKFSALIKSEKPYRNIMEEKIEITVTYDLEQREGIAQKVRSVNYKIEHDGRLVYLSQWHRNYFGTTIHLCASSIGGCCQENKK